MLYEAEAAKSNRSVCRETSCKLHIGAGELRIGIQGSDYFSWYHAPCTWKTFINRRICNPEIKSTKAINNFEKLSAKHQVLIQELIAGTYVEPPAMSYNPRPKRTCAATTAVAATVESEVASKKQRK